MSEDDALWMQCSKYKALRVLSELTSEQCNNNTNYYDIKLLTTDKQTLKPSRLPASELALTLGPAQQRLPHPGSSWVDSDKRCFQCGCHLP